jgi:helicase
MLIFKIMLDVKGGVTPPQAEVLRCNLPESGFNVLLQMATGSGKTWLAEYAIKKCIAKGHRAIYLAPTRALAQEIFSKWNAGLPDTRTGIFTGDYGPSGNSFPVSFKKAQILVMTPERLDACTRNWRTHWNWIPEVDLLVVDEFHLLGDGGRGARLEGSLCRFRRLNPFVRLLGLSATLGNREELANWLDAVDFVADWRPTPLTWRIVHYRKADEKPLLAATEIQRVVQSGGKSLVFVQSRRRAETLAEWLRAQGLNAIHHHAGLDVMERQKVEAGFRNHHFNVMVATATLEVGINLPVRQVVLYDLQSFNGQEYRPLEVNQVWQRVGRAGRPGLDTEGEAVLIAPSWQGKEAQLYKNGKFEPIISGLADQRALAEQIIAEVSSGLCKTRSDLKAIFAITLASHQVRLPLLDPLVNELCQAGLLKEEIEDNDTKSRLKLKPTALGRIVARQMLAPSSILLFQKVIQTRRNLRFFDLLLVAAASEDCEPILQVDYEELSSLSISLSNESSQLLKIGIQALTDLLGVQGLRLLAAIKVALLMRAWTRQSDVEILAQRFNCYPFEIHRLRSSMDRLLSAMSHCVLLTDKQEDLISLPDDTEPNLNSKIIALKNMINAGLNETTITLTLIPGLGPKMATRLAQHGIKDIEDLAQCDPESITDNGGISEKRASKWIQMAEELMGCRTYHYFNEAHSDLARIDCAWIPHIDPYRVRRALELQVTQISERCYQVTGGSDPHKIELDNDQLRCDCLDTAKGNICKHVIAVNITRNDPIFLGLRDQLLSNHQNDFDLFNLWINSGRRY